MPRRRAEIQSQRPRAHRIGAPGLPEVRPHRHAPVDRRHETTMTRGQPMDAKMDQDFDGDGCVRNAACSASSAILMPQPSPRSACTRSAPRPGGRRHRHLRRQALSLRAAALASLATTSPPRGDRRLPGTTAVAMSATPPPAKPSCATCSRCSPELEGGGFAIGHNGNLTNGLALRRMLVHEGAMMQSTTDTEVILHLVARRAETALSIAS